MLIYCVPKFKSINEIAIYFFLFNVKHHTYLEWCGLFKFLKQNACSTYWLTCRSGEIIVQSQVHVGTWHFQMAARCRYLSVTNCLGWYKYMLFLDYHEGKIHVITSYSKYANYFNRWTVIKLILFQFKGA